MAGWSNMLSWIVGAAANVAVMSFQVGFLATLFNPSYEVKNWHIFLIMECLLFFNLLMNAFGTRLLPKIDAAEFWWYVNISEAARGPSLMKSRFLASFFVVSIVAVASANPHQPAKYVFATFVNETGWDNSFVVFMNGKSDDISRPDSVLTSLKA